MFNRDRSLMYVEHIVGSATFTDPEPLTVGHLNDHLTGTTPRPIIFSTRSTLNSTLRVMERTSHIKYRLTAGALRHLTALPASTKATVLTDALAHTYSTPDNLDLPSVRTWRTLFDLDAGLGALYGLVDTCAHQDLWTDSSKTSRNASKRFGSYERTILHRSKSTGTDAANSVFTATENAHTAWNAIRCLDPLGRIEALTTGEVALATPTTVTSEAVDVELSYPCRVKPGKVIVLSHADREPELVMDDISVDENGTMSTRLEPGSVRSRDKGLTIDSMFARGDGCMVMNDPYLPFPRRRDRNDGKVRHVSWTLEGGIPEREAKDLNMPLEVLLTGADTD